MAQIGVTDLARVREILGILRKHGFGRLLVQAGLGRYVPEGGEDGAEGEHWAVRVRQALAELGPAYVKLGQVLSVRPDIVPARLAEELQLLLDRVPPVGFEEIRQVVEEDLQGPLEERFASFEPEAMASASIAQVHRATLPDGTRVAVKVRRPDIVPIIEADLRILHALARLVEGRFELPGVYTPVTIVSEFDHAIHQELDFLLEAHNCERFRASIAERHPDIAVPEVYPSHSARRVLTLELMEGRAVGQLDPGDPQAAALARKLLEASYTQVFENGLYHADPHPGNLLLLPDGRLGYLDFGLVGAISAEMQQVLSAIFTSIVFKDADGLVLAFTRAGASHGRIDMKALKGEIEREMARLHGVSITDLTGGANLMNFIEIITRHRLVMPREYAVLARTSNLVFGITRTLLPNVDIVAEVRPLAERLVSRQLSPDRLAAEAARVLLSARSGVSQLPLQATQLLADLEAGRLQLNTRNPEQESILLELRAIGLRIAMALCVAALFVGGAIMLSTTEFRIAGLRMVPVIGLLVMAASGVVWLGLVAHAQLAGLFSMRGARRGLAGLLRFFIGQRNHR
jgi:ubiquinone biosynthesis protein